MGKQSQHHMPDWHTTRGIATLDGMSINTLQDAIRTGLLGDAVQRDGKRLLVDRNHPDYQKWYEQWQHRHSRQPQPDSPAQALARQLEVTPDWIYKLHRRGKLTERLTPEQQKQFYEFLHSSENSSKTP